MFRVVATLAATAAFAGCVGSAGLATWAAPDLRAEVVVDADEFDSDVTFLGVERQIDGHDKWNTAFLRSWLNAKGVSHQIYVVHYYRHDWRFYERASGIGGRSVDFVSIDRDVVDCTAGTCSYNEVFGVSLSDSELRAATSDGFRFKAYARSGHELEVFLSPEQVRAQLAAIERYRGGGIPSPKDTPVRVLER